MCGVIGVFGVENPLDVLGKMMIALDHRGQQGAGMVLARSDGSSIYQRSAARYPNMDLAMRIESLNIDGKGFFAGIGHLRYGITGSLRSLENTQPFYGKTIWGELYVSHNGDTSNFDEMKQELFNQGVVFSTSSDTEFIIRFIGLSKEVDPIQAIKHGLRAYKGAYSLVMLIQVANEWKLIAARDPHGIRPLALGKLGDGYIVASENSAFETVGGQFLREIKNNEILVISSQKLDTYYIDPMLLIDETSERLHHCIFENVYLSFSSSTIFGIPVDYFREELGRRAARRFGHLIKEEDVLTNPPESSNFFAKGFCRELNRQLEDVFIKRPLTPRSFMQESDEARDEALRIKFSIIGRRIEGKRVWLKEDSVVRGKTGRRLTRSLKANGAKEVGIIVGFPPVMGPCKKGVDMNDLIVTRHLHDGKPDIERIRKEIEADFLLYLTFNDLTSTIRALNQNPNNFCFGCLENRDPVWNKW